MPSNDRLYLTGYRGTGKTTVGRTLAARLGCECVDLDDCIETAAGMTIRDIFASGGEATFRDWETRCLQEVACGEIPAPASGAAGCGGIVALGGGAILRQTNREILAQSGRCVWLVASPAAIAERLFGDATTAERRPALTDLSPVQEIAQLLAEREPLYRQVADFSVDTEARTPQEIADQIAEWWRRRVE